MSDYPPVPPYGASYGSQPQTNPPYLQPTYPNQYMQQDDGRAAQTHMANNYDTSMSAYGYNNSIPGFNASSSGAVAPPLPIYQGWNQDTIPLPSYSTPQNNMQYAGYGSNSYQNQQSYPPPQPQQHTYHQNAHVAPYDDGEVSEGEYGGQKTGGAAEYGPNYYQSNDTGYMSTAHRAVYPTGQDYSNQHYPHGNGYSHYQQESQASRQKSDSYSPYAASPLEAGQDERWKSKQKYNGYAPVPPESSQSSSRPNETSAPRHHKSVERSPTVAQPAPAVPAFGNINGGDHTPFEQNRMPNTSNAERNSTIQAGQDRLSNPPNIGLDSAIQARITDDENTLPSPPITQLKTGSQTGFPKSVSEARKRAERAILNLWPYEVRFPNYVEEGLDENIVGRLFDDLGFSRAPKATTLIAETKPSSVNGANSEKATTSNRDSGVLANSERSEGRGVLVEKSSNPSTTAASTTQVKPTEPTEKEKNLKMKMEALRKSREERAQKAAAKTNASSSAAPAPLPDSITAAASDSSKPNSNPSPLPPTQAPTVNNEANASSSISQLPPAPPQPPIIPGLFLAATSSPSPSTHNTMFGVPSNHRKRPVAADFDTPTSSTSFKRPFGESRNDSLVIDVSEEESDSDEDVAMDLESQADQDSPVQSARNMSDQRATALQNLPPLTNFPTRKAFTTPPSSSTASTPPVHPRGHPHVLQQKETEIELRKKKMAEAEAAKAAKRKAQKTSSGAATPQCQPTNGISGANNSDIASKVQESMQIQQLIGITGDKVTSDQKRLAETQAAELEKTAELKRNEAERRRLRREKIATDLPLVDAEVEQSQLKLQQLREEMAKIEAAVQKSLEDKRRMAEEMERLGQEAEDQLQEQKDKLKDLTSAETETISAIPRRMSAPTAKTEIEQVTLPSRSMSSKPDPVPANGFQRSVASSDFHAQSKPTEGSDGTSDQALEAALQEQVRTEAGSHDQEEVDMDIEDSYAPDPARLAPESSPSEAVLVEDNSVVQDGEVLPDQLPLVQPISAIGEVNGQDDEDDDYEPPEATPPVDVDTHSPPFSPAPPESLDGFEQFSKGTRGLGDAVVEHHVGELHVNGSIPELQGGTESSNHIQFFTPYESPLKHFRAFRFHPDFKQEVAGGLKSMTYSHKIDPNTEFCRYELAGGVCNDKLCEFQHFRDIVLPEDSILSALGSPEEFPADQQQKFREGLRQVLTGLRSRQVRDFDTIAAEVVAHRSHFLGDPSKILMLEGTTL